MLSLTRESTAVLSFWVRDRSVGSNTYFRIHETGKVPAYLRVLKGLGFKPFGRQRQYLGVQKKKD
jgi:hypothetical protein